MLILRYTIDRIRPTETRHDVRDESCRETKEREGGRTLNRRSVRRRRPRLREEQTRSAGGLGQQSGELKRSGFSREVNRGGRAKQSCKRLWVHTFRALRVVPAVRWSGAGRCGVSGGKVAWREREDEASSISDSELSSLASPHRSVAASVATSFEGSISDTSGVASKYFPKRYFILKSLSQVCFSILHTSIFCQFS